MIPNSFILETHTAGESVGVIAERNTLGFIFIWIKNRLLTI
jgi:hypothetical protein